MASFASSNTRSNTRTALRSFAAALLVAAGLSFAGPAPASAIEQVASGDDLAKEACRAAMYQGFLTGASSSHCRAPLFAVPSSAAFRCGLYREAGFYPSSLMHKACKLYDAGVIKAFVQDLAVY